jgi:hypothetical protein
MKASSSVRSGGAKRGQSRTGSGFRHQVDEESLIVNGDIMP